MEREDEFDILPEQQEQGKQAPESELDEDVDVFTLDQVSSHRMSRSPVGGCWCLNNTQSSQMLRSQLQRGKVTAHCAAAVCCLVTLTFRGGPGATVGAWSVMTVYPGHTRSLLCQFEALKWVNQLQLCTFCPANEKTGSETGSMQDDQAPPAPYLDIIIAPDPSPPR